MTSADITTAASVGSATAAPRRVVAKRKLHSIVEGTEIVRKELTG